MKQKYYTLEQKERLLLLQYVCEKLIEDYQNAEKESKKYEILLKFLIFIDDKEYNISFVKDYLMLQEDKFMPLIHAILDIKKSSKRYKTNEEAFGDNSIEGKMFIMPLMNGWRIEE